MKNGSTSSATWVSLVLKSIGAVVFLVGFVTFDYFMFEHEYAAAIVVLAACLLLAPFLVADSWQGRSAGVVVMLFVFLGLLAGTAVFFSMFNFHWFDRVFNNKGGGLAPWAIFLFVFAGIGGYSGYGCVRLIAWWRGPVRREHGEPNGDGSVS